MDKNNLSIEDLLLMSSNLYEKNKDSWSPMTPEYGKNFILYMIEEIGEVIAVLKKKSIEDVMDNGGIRAHFVEELSDVLMYFIDTLNRYKVSKEEFSNAYYAKYLKNMNRDYKKDHNQFLSKKKND
jgi:NTP pyrophosphatase (non-canonical NTP hydrolase)